METLWTHDRRLGQGDKVAPIKYRDTRDLETDRRVAEDRTILEENSLRRQSPMDRDAFIHPHCHYAEDMETDLATTPLAGIIACVAVQQRSLAEMNACHNPQPGRGEARRPRR